MGTQVTPEPEKKGELSATDRLLKAVRHGDVTFVPGDEERFSKMGLEEKDLDALRAKGAIQGFGGKKADLDSDPTVIVTAASSFFAERKDEKMNHVHGDDDFFGEASGVPAAPAPRREV